jgi:prepilin peptidase CpaA
MMAALANPVGMVVFAFAMVQAGLSDLTTMQIRNGLVLLLLVTFAVLVPLAGFSNVEIVLSVVGATVVLGLGFLCFARGWIGGGDAKLAAVTSLWLGFDYTIAYVIHAALLGGLLALILMQFRTLMPVLPPFMHNVPWIARLHSPDCGVPYGIALAAAALIVFPHTRWMTVLF